MSTTQAPRYLITAASGHIGQRLVPTLISQSSKPELYLITSNSRRLEEQLGEYAKDARVHIVEGRLQNARFLEDVMGQHRITGLFLCLTGTDELMMTLNIFDAIKQAGTVKHVVFVSAHGDFGLDAIRNGALRNNASGHMLVKYIIEAKLRYGTLPREESGGFSWTILGPTLFYDNDLRSKDSMLTQGLFDEPLGNKGVSRINCEDIALAAANSFEDDGKRWGGKKIALGSLQTYTLEQVTKLWSDALETPLGHLDYGLDGLKYVEDTFEKLGGDVWARDVRLMYDFFGEEGYAMTQAEYDEQVELLGREPSKYEDFVKSTAQKWREEKNTA